MGEKLKYGSAGERYAVKPGDVWSAGRHNVVCADLEDDGEGLDSLIDRFLGVYGPFAMAYVDPPYNPALATGYRTKAGVSRKVDFEALILRICRLLKRFVPGDVFLETAVKEEERLCRLVEEAWGAVQQVYGITYYGKKPARLIHCSFNNPTVIGDELEGMDDEYTPLWCIQKCSEPRETVLDLCMGRGLTAVSAEQAGRRAVGVELHPNRLSVTLSKLADLGYAPKLEITL